MPGFRVLMKAMNFQFNELLTLRYFLLLHYGGIYLDLDNVSTYLHQILFRLEVLIIQKY